MDSEVLPSIIKNVNSNIYIHILSNFLGLDKYYQSHLLCRFSNTEKLNATIVTYIIINLSRCRIAVPAFFTPQPKIKKDIIIVINKATIRCFFSEETVFFLIAFITGMYPKV